MDQIIWLLDGTQSDGAIDMSQVDTEEECSFLKIENVISLAPKSDNTGNESSIVSGEYISQYFLIFEILSNYSIY